MKLKNALTFAVFFLLPLPTFAQAPFIQPPEARPYFSPPAPSFPYCDNIPLYYEQILADVAKKNPDAIASLPECFKLDRTLILKAVVIDPTQFQNASDVLLEDQVFVKRLLKISPQVLQYASPEIRSDAAFMENATYLSRDALQYAGWSLLDNKLFMKRMIKIDSRNYKFASDRLREIPEFAEVAFADNGLMLEFAPAKIKSDKRLVKIAVKSNSSAFEFAADNLKDDRDLKKLSQNKTSIKSLPDLQKFLEENYIVSAQKKNLGFTFGNQGKFFQKNELINRNYVTKWQRNLDFYHIQDGHVNEDLRLISADSRNYPTSWREDFKKYPCLSKKIENFFLNHNIDRSTLDSLSVTYLWKIKSKPQVLAFNLYLLRDNTDDDLGPEFSDITSLTAIAEVTKNKCQLSVVEVIFDSEMKMDVGYENGHKQYVLWDLYTVNKKDKNPKIIFKVEDRFSKYLEVFEEQSGGKYQRILRTDNLFDKSKSGLIR